MASGGNDPVSTKAPLSSRTSPLSNTVLVSSSMKSGTPSVRARIWSITSLGTDLLRAMLCSNAVPSRRFKRVSDNVAMCASFGHDAATLVAP